MKYNITYTMENQTDENKIKVLKDDQALILDIIEVCEKYGKLLDIPENHLHGGIYLDSFFHPTIVFFPKIGSHIFKLSLCDRRFEICVTRAKNFEEYESNRSKDSTLQLYTFQQWMTLDRLNEFLKGWKNFL